MTALDLLALLVYTFGAYAYGTILFLSLREYGRRGWAGQPRLASVPSAEAEIVGALMLTLGTVWFLANLTSTIVSVGPDVDDWPYQMATLWLAFLYPLLIMHVTVAEHSAHQHEGRAPLAPVWRLWLWPAYAVGLGVPLWATLAFAGAIANTDRTVHIVINTALAASFIAASVYSVLMSARHPRTAATPRQRFGDRAMTIMFGVTVMLFILLPAIAFSSNPSLGAIAGRSVEIAAKSLPLAFLFVGAYYESRFDFFDILLKRGLALFATIGALAGYVALAWPVLRRFEGSARPWVYAVSLLPIVLTLPWIHARIGAVLDRWWLGRRYATVDAVKHFIATLRSATTETQLVERAEQALTEIFGAPAAVHLDATGAPPAEFDVLQEIPVQSASGVRGSIRMGPRESEAPYFSEDVTLLATLADLLASVADNLHLQARKQEHEQRAQELSLHASRSELKALRAQINPHFLFNALNAIAGLIHQNPAGADRTIERLADVFRYTLRGSETEWATLHDELEFVRAYLEVERARFGDRLEVDVHPAESARAARVPTMMVQTLVENAVKHGLSDLRGAAIVRVDARVDGDRLVVSVTDNGPGFDASAGPSTERRAGGYGLVNVRQRLQGYFNGRGALTVDRDEERGLTTVSIVMPLVSPGHPHEALR